MAICELSDTCYCLNKSLSNNTQAQEILRNYFCNSDFFICARHQIALSRGFDNIPPDLLPLVLRGQSAFAEYGF